MGNKQTITVTFKIADDGSITVLDNVSWNDANPRLVDNNLGVEVSIPSWFGYPESTVVSCDPSTKSSFVIRRNITTSTITIRFVYINSLFVGAPDDYCRINSVVKYIGVDEGSRSVMKMTISITRPASSTVNTSVGSSVYYYVDSINNTSAINTNVTSDGIFDYNYKRLEQAIKPRERAISSPSYLDVNINMVNFNVVNMQYLLLFTIKPDLSVTYDNFYAPIVNNVSYNQDRNSIIIQASSSSPKFTTLVNITTSGLGVPTTLSGIISAIDSNVYELRLYASGSIVNISNADNLGRRIAIPDLVKNGPIELSLLVL